MDFNKFVGSKTKEFSFDSKEEFILQLRHLDTIDDNIILVRNLPKLISIKGIPFELVDVDSVRNADKITADKPFGTILYTTTEDNRDKVMEELGFWDFTVKIEFAVRIL